MKLMMMTKKYVADSGIKSPTELVQRPVVFSETTCQNVS